MNESPAPIVSATSVARGGHVHRASRDEAVGALGAAGHDDEGGAEREPARLDLGDRRIRIQPGDVLVAGLHDVGERDQALDPRPRLVGRAHELRPHVRDRS